MHFENLFTTADIGQWNDDLSVKTPRSQQCRIKHIRSVGRGYDDNAFATLKSVHFDQHLIKRLFTFVMATAESCTAMTPYRVQLIDEDNTRRLFLCLLKHVAHS